MAELQEEESRLRSIKERDTDYWNHALAALGQAPQAGEVHDTEACLSSLHLAEHSDLSDGGNGSIYIKYLPLYPLL